MPQRATPLLTHMYTRFREAFGVPSNLHQPDTQWTLHPNSDSLAPALFMLVDSSNNPAVWLFDPYDGGDNVWRSGIEADADVDRIIKRVQAHLAAAAACWHKNDAP